MSDRSVIAAAALLGALLSSASLGPIVEQALSPILTEIGVANLSRTHDEVCADVTVVKARAARAELIAWTLSGDQDADPAFLAAYVARTGRVLRAEPPLPPGRSTARLCWRLAAADWLRDDATLTLTGLVTFDGWAYWRMPYRIGPATFARPPDAPPPSSESPASPGAGRWPGPPQGPPSRAFPP